MWLCQRLILAGICARSPHFIEGGSVQTTKNTKCCSSVTYGRRKLSWYPNCASFGRAVCAAKLRLTQFTKIRLRSTEHSTEAPKQPSAFVYLLKWGVVTFLVATVVSSTIVWWELWSLRQNLSNVTSTLSGSQMENSFSSLSLYPWQTVLTNKQLSMVADDESGVWFPWLQSKSQDPFTLLELCRSKNKAVRKLGIRALASKTSWEDYQYRYVAQAADYSTLIGLSRAWGADPRFFLHQPALLQTQRPILEELASLLLTVDQQQSDQCVDRGSSPYTAAAMLAHQHVHHKHRPTDDKIRFWGFDGSSLDVASVNDPPPEDQMLQQFLSALAQLCCNAQQASVFVREHGMAVLQRVADQHQNTETFTAVASVLGNLALHAACHESIVRSGWLGVLKGWTESGSSKLAVSAARVLTNMDRDWTSELLEDGVVILHPLHRSRKTVLADIVFVHGLLGGAVKTWRQQDSAAKAPHQKDSYSDCWPKDWLAEDCPHVRIISVHYDTALTSWSADNSTSKEKCTLEGRSKELLDKLQKAGVGLRPVIWVGHSMGGLLVKQMLELCDSLGQLHSAMKSQTCGLLLFAVPHHGLSLAALSSQVHYLLYPSTEVQELKAGSQHLNRLHEHFKRFVESSNIPCLSFGELDKTKLRKTLPKILLVPQQSSDPGVGEFCLLPLNHINICKPDSRDSDLYQQTLAFVYRCIFFSYVHKLRKGVSSALD